MCFCQPIFSLTGCLKNGHITTFLKYILPTAAQAMCCWLCDLSSLWLPPVWRAQSPTPFCSYVWLSHFPTWLPVIPSWVSNVCSLSFKSKRADSFHLFHYQVTLAWTVVPLVLDSELCSQKVAQFNLGALVTVGQIYLPQLQQAAQQVPHVGLCHHVDCDTH